MLRVLACCMVLEMLSVVVEEFEIRLLSIWHAEIAEALKVVSQGMPQGLGQNVQSASHAKLRQPMIPTEGVGEFSRCTASAIGFLSGF